MTTTNLFSRIRQANSEDITTEVLAYLMQTFDSCVPVFLSLIDSSVSSNNCEVMTQYFCADGRPDLVVCDKSDQWIVLIENKPWNESAFTSIHESGDQLKRYATYLKKSDFRKKTLCLLATEKNQDKLMQDANVVSDDELSFVVITWEQIFSRLKEVYPENTTESFLLHELQGYILPLPTVIPPEVLLDEEKIGEHWNEIKAIVKEAKDIAKVNPALSNYDFSNKSGNCQKPDDHSLNFSGYYIKDKVSYLTYFVAADIDARRFLGTLGKPSLFVLQVRFKEWQSCGFHNRANGKEIIDPKILTTCGFEFEKSRRADGSCGCEYVYPLTDSTGDHTIRAEELATALSAILKKTSDAINNGETFSDH